MNKFSFNNSNQVMNQLTKQSKFFKLKYFKRPAPTLNTQQSILRSTSLPTAKLPELKKFHQIIHEILKDYYYEAEYKKQQKNYTQGQKVLKMNGIKIIKQNQTYFIQKYIMMKQDKGKQMNLMPNDTFKVQFIKVETITDPSFFIQFMGYVNKQKSDYIQYSNLEVYKCPAYGIEIVIYPYNHQQESQYVEIQMVSGREQKNLVGGLLMEKLGVYMIEDQDIDPYTLKPKMLKPYIFNQYML